MTRAPSHYNSLEILVDPLLSELSDILYRNFPQYSDKVVDKAFDEILEMIANYSQNEDLLEGLREWCK